MTAGVLPDTGLLDDLRLLDAVLDRAMVRAHETTGVAPGADPHRGLYVSPADTDRLLALPAGGALLGGEMIGPAAPVWAQLAERFGLGPFEVGVALLALAPEIDLRYERIYAYLQDDVTRRRPTVDLCLELLCETPAQRLMCRPAFDATAPLVSGGLARIVADPHHVEPPLLARYVVLDERVVADLLGHRGMDGRLAGVVELTADPGAAPPALPPGQLEAIVRLAGDATDPGAAPPALPPGQLEAIVRLAREATDRGDSLWLRLRGDAGSGRRCTAGRLAAQLAVPLLTVDLEAAREHDPALADVSGLVAREQALTGAVVCLHGAHALAGADGRAPARRLRTALSRSAVVVVTTSDAGTCPLAPSAPTITVPELPVAQRAAAWRGAVEREGLTAGRAEVDAVAARFRFTPPQITAAAHAARTAAIIESRPADLFAAARDQSHNELAAHARKITPRVGWNDIVLTADRRAQLAEICDAVRYRAIVHDDWGFGRKLSLGKGVTALFTGPPGTGKTMAAEVIAGELGLDLFRIDVSAVVSKYIGETEKNLARVFSEAETTDAILFFDEADALFGRRSAVRDAHDRYSNIEVAYLLQRIEEHEGVTILASNLRKNIDDAFARRLHFVVDFPFPDEAGRRQIWESIWPGSVPRGGDVDPEALARRYELPGGNIRNIALASAFLAAADGRLVTMDLIARAARRELQNMGKILPASELGAGR